MDIRGSLLLLALSTTSAFGQCPPDRCDPSDRLTERNIEKFEYWNRRGNDINSNKFYIMHMKFSGRFDIDKLRESNFLFNSDTFLTENVAFYPRTVGSSEVQRGLVYNIFSYKADNNPANQITDNSRFEFRQIVEGGQIGLVVPFHMTSRDFSPGQGLAVFFAALGVFNKAAKPVFRLGLGEANSLSISAEIPSLQEPLNGLINAFDTTARPRIATDGRKISTRFSLRFPSSMVLNVDLEELSRLSEASRSGSIVTREFKNYLKQRFVQNNTQTACFLVAETVLNDMKYSVEDTAFILGAYGQVRAEINGGDEAARKKEVLDCLIRRDFRTIFEKTDLNRASLVAVIKPEDYDRISFDWDRNAEGFIYGYANALTRRDTVALERASLPKIEVRELRTPAHLKPERLDALGKAEMSATEVSEFLAGAGLVKFGCARLVAQGTARSFQMVGIPAAPAASDRNYRLGELAKLQFEVQEQRGLVAMKSLVIRPATAADVEIGQSCLGGDRPVVN